MSRVVLLRHAHSSANQKGILSGRSEGVGLSSKGREQAEELVSRLSEAKFSAIRISPMQRCFETIDPWLSKQSAATQKNAIIDEMVTEVDFGLWTGKSISRLSLKKEWKTVQKNPEEMIFPNGEALKNLQNRALTAVANIASNRGSNPKLIVTHADVIKAILSGILTSGLKDFQKFAVEPASISIIDFDKRGSKILTINNTHTKLVDLLGSQ